VLGVSLGPGRRHEEVRTLPELRAKKRARVATKKFGLPERARSSDAKKETGNYPMPDRRHAATAKARAKQQLGKKKLSRARYDRIVSKADRILKGSSD
jgi:hypothetical protein